MSAICGIFGGYAQKREAKNELAHMLHAVENRGPDGIATHADSKSNVLMGMRWLRTSPGSTPPQVFSNEDGSLQMVCDGVVFNKSDVASWLRGKGHSIAQEDSCELLLHLYEQEGADGWRRADAQFALAIWDRARNRMIFGRDFFGLRALYYTAGPKGVLFASEIKSLLGHSEAPRGLDVIALSQHLTFLNVPGPRTLVDGIQKLPPATVAICGTNGSEETRVFWDLTENPIEERDNEKFYVDRVRELHHRSVGRRKVDGPIGALLSGGNDSSANVSLLARAGSSPLHTFTVGLAELEGQSQYSDIYHAAKVAEYVKSDHHPLLLSTDEFIQTIPRTVDAMDDIVSEPSSIFLYHALRMAGEMGLKVVVAGEANDELCCGHGEMIRLRRGYYEKWLPYMRLPRVVRKAIAMASPVFSPDRKAAFEHAANDGEYFWNFEIAWMDSEKRDLLTPLGWDQCQSAMTPASIVERSIRRFRATEHGKRDYLNYIIYMMMQDYYFGNLQLGKLDLLSASVGVEARCPYIEPEYAHFVFNVPAQFKAKDDTVKYFFKKAIEGVLPDEIIYRKKQGFRAPVIELFRGALGDWSRPILLEGGLTRAGLFKASNLETLLTRHRNRERDFSTRLWTAMMLNLWYDRWIARRQGGDPPQSRDVAVLGSAR